MGETERRLIVSLGLSALCVLTFPATLTILVLSALLYRSEYDADQVLQQVSAWWPEKPQRDHWSELWTRTLSPLVGEWVQHAASRNRRRPTAWSPPPYVPRES